MAPTSCHHNYADDSGLLVRVFSLLDLAFPGLSALARSLEPLGLRWDEASTPFLVIEEERLLSHVGVLELHMVLDGREMLVGGIHAVCTHPDSRRRGYFRLAMDEALAWCDTRYETAMLIAGTPEIYEPFGFSVVSESRFVMPTDKSARAANGQRLRLLDLDDAADLSILHRLLDTRTPVSQRLGMVHERAVFLFAQAKQPMWYAEDLDAILCFEITNETLCLYDIVATRMPTLEMVLNYFDSPLKRVEVNFAPDQLNARLTPEPHMVEADSWLMVRGGFCDVKEGLMLPTTCRF